MDSRASLEDKSKEELIALLLSQDAAAAELQSKYDAAQSRYEAAEAEVNKLQGVIKQLQRALFGRRSEKLDPDQLQLAFEDVEQSLGTAEQALDDAADSQGIEKRPTKPRRNRGALPRHLPREEVVIPPEDEACPCCGGALHVIGEDVSEQLDVIPAQFKVKVIRRPRYGCRACESAVVQAPAPARLIDGGLPTEAMVANVLVSKYLDHLPLYRQAEIYARQGIALDRATLANWVGRAAWWLTPLHERLLEEIVGSEKIFADDTTVPVLDPGRGRTKTGRLWAYARDDRPWQGTDPPAVAYVYSEDRRHEHPADHLKEFKGTLQVDAFAGFDRLAGSREDNDVVLAHCWAHTRRKFYDVHQANASPIAAEALSWIADLYKVETEIRGRSAEERRKVRMEKSRAILDAFKPWLEAQLARVSAKSPLAAAMRYTLARWDSLNRYVEDGRIEIDTNTVERTMRPIALGRKNHLFAGSDGGAATWSIIASVIQSARLNNLEPFAYLSDILERMVQGHPINRIDELLPWSYAKDHRKAA